MRYLANLKILLILFLSCKFLFAAFEKKEAGARELSLGNALVAFQGVPFAIYYNPANIISQKNLNIFASYRTYYGLNDIYQADLVANTTLLNTPASFAVSKYGNDLYSEIQFSCGSSINVMDEFALGGSLQLYSLSIKNYGSSQTWGINLGISYNAFEKIRIGAFITNINNPTIGKVEEELPKTFSLGVSYNLFEKGIFLFELCRDIRYEQDYRAGFEYEVFNHTYLRAGISDNTNSYSFGAGSEIEMFVFDYALLVHDTLGTSHVLSMGVNL